MSEAQLPQGEFAHVAIAALSFSKSTAQAERRSHFDKTALKELTEDIKVKGVLQPIVVRPVEPKNGAEHFEVVAGERRVRGAKEADLVLIPAMIRKLTDEQALDVQLVENLQREGLHELVECEGFEQLKKNGSSIEQIAAKVNRSTSYVYKRLELSACKKAVRKAFYEGEIDAARALLLSRLQTEELQAKALKEILTLYGDPMSYRQAVEHVRRQFMQRLDDAPFDTNDANLVPAAGACEACPYNTAAKQQAELFGNVSKGDARCTNGKCFQEKTVAATAIKVKDSQAAGKKVLEGKDAKKALAGMDKGYSRPHYNVPGDSQYRSFEKVLGKKNLEQVTTIAVDPADGKSVELVDLEAAKKLIKEKGIKLSAPRPNSSSSPKESAAAKEKREKEAAERKFIGAVLKAIHEKAPKPLTDDELYKVADIVADHSYGLDILDQAFGEGNAPDVSAKLKPDGLLRVIRTYLLAEHAEEGDYKLILATANRHGVNVEKIKAELAAPPAPKAEKAKAKKASKKK